MGILHELLAAEVALRETGQGILDNVKHLFTAGIGRLHGLARIYTTNEEFGEIFPDEIVARATSVDEELIKVARDYGAWMDAAVQKEMTNTKARAELSINDISFGSLPATALLNIESKLKDLIPLYASVPILDPTKRWARDEEVGCWRSDTETRYKTEKRQEAIVLYPATPEHPAQTQLITNDVRIGRYDAVTYSGALARTDAQGRLDRARQLLVAVKKARARANEQETVNFTIAEKIFNFINGSKP